MKLAFALVAGFAALVYFMLFGEVQWDETELARFAMDGPAGLSPALDDAPAEFDATVSSDGGGSLRIEADAPLLLELADVPGYEQDLSFRQLLFDAHVKTRDVTGPVFLVMQAGVEPGMPVTGLEHAIRGTHDWTRLQAAAGNPANTVLSGPTRLQLEIRGTGTVWIDDLRLVSRRAR